MCWKTTPVWQRHWELTGTVWWHPSRPIPPMCCLVTEEDAGKGVVRERDYTDVDGLITNVPDLTLATFYADCVPLYFVDPKHKAIGLSHSGGGAL